ncbi:MAG: hypothetical protein GF383_13565 [Candidatus Lokiarchaeota archaeon]|nr:hypothetical protein [Candidatus Lokiarchaeota archaeon]MBD3342253.1 hypothetical protein [Candidatus Lokiarchaeota archaeon]
MKKIIIIGGGFGGLNAARKLERWYKVVLIDPLKSLVYNPLLHEVALGEIPREAVKAPFTRILKRSTVLNLAVKRVEFQKKRVFLENKKALPYDYLIISTGCKAFKPIEGSQNYPSLKNLDDALKIRTILREAIKKSSVKIAIVGEGLTGIELTGEMIKLKEIHRNKKITVDQFLYKRGYFPNRPNYNQIFINKMKDLGVRLHQAEPVLSIKDKKITTETKVYEFDFIFVCTGIKPVVIETDLERESGYFEVDEFLQIRNVKDAFAIGDISKYNYLGKDKLQLAQLAKREGLHMAKNLKRKQKGKKVQKFKPKIYIRLISVGKNFGVGLLFERYVVKGFLPWLVKRTYYFYEMFTLRRDFNLIKHYFLSILKNNRFLKVNSRKI